MWNISLKCTVQHYFSHSAEPEEKDIKFKAEDIYNNRFLPDDDGDSDEDDETSPFEKMIKKMEDISPNKDGMVYKKILTQGSGNVVPEEAIVRSELMIIEKIKNFNTCEST